jgi:hypothetical protein
MRPHLAKRIARPDQTDTSTPDHTNASWIRARSGVLPMVVTAVAASLVVIGPTPAQATSTTTGVKIVNAAGGLRADVMWGSVDPFQGVFLWPNNSNTSQQFDLIPTDQKFFRIRARHSGQCLMLDWRGGGYMNGTNGTKIIQYPACGAGYTPAEWWLDWRSTCTQDVCSSNDETYALIRNRRTGRCLDAGNQSGGVPGQKAVLQEWKCIDAANDWNAGNQMWNIAPATSQTTAHPGRVRID